MIERQIDYMQFSVMFQETNCILKGFERVSPQKFFSRGYRDKFGIRYYFGNPKSPKCSVIISGEPMQTLRDTGKLDAEIVQWALDAGAKFSRLDLAVTEWNTFDGMVTVGDIAQWANSGLIDSSLVSGGIKLLSSLKEKGLRQDETLYIGNMSKRARRGLFRAYDKGEELGIGLFMATRLELELRQDKSHTTAVRLSESNDISGNFRAYFNVKHNDFDRLMDADAVSTKRGVAKLKREEEEATAKRWEWLLNQVAPALKEAIKFEREQGRGDVMLGKFMEASGIMQGARAEIEQRARDRYNSYLRDNGFLESLTK